jgi:ABC-type branched-subunit amino acid transport system ATPase component/predicted MFS family arabinose efflux permease
MTAATTELSASPAPETPGTPPRGRGLKAITGGFPAAPLAVLFGLNLVDEFDRVAFSALLPEIRDAFGLSDGQVLTLGAITGVFTLIAALPLGVLADRFNRVRLSIFAAILWGVTSVLTGVVPGLVLLYLVRLGSGLGRIINEVVHPSLLADYYPRDNQPRVFGVHRAANPIGNIGGPLAGLVAATFFWQAAFWILAIPTAVFVAMAIVRLREPNRGESIDAELAAQSELDAESTPYGEARRQLFAIKTLRRLWLGAFFLGVGALQIGNILGIYFDRVYGVGPVGRGMVQLLFGAGNLVGLIFGARLAGRASEAGRLNRLAVITGLSFVQFAAGLVILGAINWVVMGYVAAFVLSLGVGAYQPAYYALVGLVSPPKIRAQAYAWAILIYGCGGLSFIFLVGVGDEDSSTRLRVIVIILAAIVALAGMIGASAQRFVDRDAEQAANALATAARLREELAAGGADKTLLVCRGVDVAYDTVQILFGVDMEVKEGEIIALLGTNGAGKSTLLKAICGLVDPIGGAIFFDGRDITHADAVQAAKAGIVQVPGGKAIFPTLTVAEHFRAGTWLFQDEDPAEVQKRIDEVLAMFPRLQERWDQLAGNMSGGEQQQLALGMAFVAKPKLLIIDELSLGLAPTIVEQLLNIVRRIHASGCTIILVEQSVNVALTIATKAYFMEKGEVRFSGPTEELLERGDILRSVFLEGTGAVGGDKTGGAAVPAAKGPDRSKPPILEVSNLSKRFGGITAVDDVSFTLAHGEILGLIGPNGAGKTTIFDLLSGLLPLDGGRIVMQGVDVTKWGADKRAAAGLGRSFQDARIFPSLTVAENVAIGLERHIEVRDHLAAALNLPAVQEAEEDVAWTVDDLIELMNLGAFRDKFVAELSTGSRRIVDLAMAIAHDPSVLILDEPSSGIAQKETEALGPLLRRIQRETGCAMLVIEHDMPLITSVSDEMIALELGAVVVRGTPQEVITNPRVVSSYLGGDIDVINRSGASTELSKRKAAAADDDEGDQEGGDGDVPPPTRRRSRRRQEVNP